MFILIGIWDNGSQIERTHKGTELRAERAAMAWLWEKGGPSAVTVLNKRRVYRSHHFRKFAAGEIAGQIGRGK